MNLNLSKLQPYPFEKLNALKADCTPQVAGHIALSIGEPKHRAPEFVLECIKNNLALINQYPLTKGSKSLRIAIANWLNQRFNLANVPINPHTQVLPVTGTREALFSFAQCFVNANENALILMPNPFYQIYEGATFLSGATPYFYNTTAVNHYRPNFDEITPATWQRCRIIYICTPSNPTGSVLTKLQLKKLIELSLKYDFIIASDECYSEIYFENNKPAGLLEVAQEMGNNTYRNCMVFHSLSKRSNLPGMRSGFVAGDETLIKNYLLYRTYHGCAMPPVHQIASELAWRDEEHVKQNRLLYAEKFKAMYDILSPVISVNLPEAGFYLWLKTPISDEDFAKGLFQQQNITVLPGRYLSREHLGINPGKNHVRLALVAPLDECITAAKRIKTFLQNL